MYNLGSKIIAHLNDVDKLVNGEWVHPITCEIDTSNYCQNDCEWCIYADYLKGARVHLDYLLYGNILKQLQEGGCKSITFTGGGEPLCHPLITRMIDTASWFGFQLGLITNGVNLAKIEYQARYFDFIRVSLDAATPETYQATKGSRYFNLVCENIKRIVDMNVTDIGVSMVYTESTKKEALEKFPALAKKLGVSYAQIKPVLNVESIESSQEIKKVGDAFITKRYLVKDELPCKIAGMIGQVAADGKYYYCCIHRGNPKYEIGDFRKESLVSLLKKRVDFKPDLSDCFSCRYMNYATEYNKVKDDQFKILRHINFL